MAQSIAALSLIPKGYRVNPQSTYLGCGFDLVGVHTEGDQSMFLSPINDLFSLFLPPPLSLKLINMFLGEDYKNK